jgi:hypothetical protein
MTQLRIGFRIGLLRDNEIRCLCALSAIKPVATKAAQGICLAGVV